MLRIAVCNVSEDSRVQSKLHKITSEHDDIRSHEFDNSSNLADAISAGQTFDLFLLGDAELRELMAKTRAEADQVYRVQTKTCVVMIPFSSIIVVESYQRALTFYTDSMEPVVSKNIRLSTSSAVNPLLADERFLLARKSCVINMSKVKSVTSNSFIMLNGMEIFVPKYAFSEAKNKYFSFYQA